jgi:tRNA (guanine-N7-)-methyltransferase
MGHKKLKKFQAILQYPNVLQYPEHIKGNWCNHFGNENPLTLELACGRGEYSLGLGKTHSDTNFIGVDIKGNRMYTGAKIALEERLTNIAFLRIQIAQITNYFDRDEVSGIWIVFPDPFLKKPSNRLTHPRFLAAYQRILKPDSVIHLKTDSPDLYEFTKEVIAEEHCRVVEDIADIYGQNKVSGPLAIQTYYEGLHLAVGRKIYYLAFSLPEHPIALKGRFARLPSSVETQPDEHTDHDA